MINLTEYNQLRDRIRELEENQQAQLQANASLRRIIQNQIDTQLQKDMRIKELETEIERLSIDLKMKEG